jgi:flagellar biosynthetic protein FliR
MSIIEQLNALLAGNVFAVLLVFARTGTALMLMPGIGSAYTPARTRLLLALGFSVAIAPIVKPELPAEPPDVIALFGLIAGEAVIGAFLGTISTIFMGVMDTAGQMISTQMGLSTAYIFNPQLANQESIPGTLLSLVAVVMIFATDMYQLLITAIVESYHVFRYDSLSMFGDMSDTVAHLVSQTFTLAVEMSAPFLVVGLLLYTVFGLIGRLLPHIQVFFVTLPLQVGLGFMVFAITSTIIMKFWMENFVETLRAMGFG